MTDTNYASKIPSRLLDVKMQMDRIPLIGATRLFIRFWRCWLHMALPSLQGKILEGST
jgi:hypothetical protein